MADAGGQAGASEVGAAVARTVVGEHDPDADAALELARLVAACDPATAVGRRDAAVMLLFLDTGIRCAELSALDLADCDLPRGRLLIRHGQGNKQRVIPWDGKTSCAHRYS